jgi:hypothetical protein
MVLLYLIRMEHLTNVSWLAVIVGAIAAFALGALWYSPSMFGDKWRKGIGMQAVHNRPMSHVLPTQAIGTFLFSWALAVAAAHSMALAVLISLAVAELVKANGLFHGSSKYAVLVEAGYVLAQAALILIAFKIF